MLLQRPLPRRQCLLEKFLNEGLATALAVARKRLVMPQLRERETDLERRWVKAIELVRVWVIRLAMCLGLCWARFVVLEIEWGRLSRVLES